MRCDSDLHETRTNAEHSETADDFRVSYESRTSKRLMYYEPQLQPDPYYRGFLTDMGVSVEECRSLLAELVDRFEIYDSYHFPLPCRGLPGLLHTKYDCDEDAADVLRLGIRYLLALIRNERKGMHNRWIEARELVRKFEDRGEEGVYLRIAERETEEARRQMAEAVANQQSVYFIGAASGPIKIGIAVRPLDRLKTLQTGHHEKLELLATCEGGQAQEAAYHKQFRVRRLHGEWFERCPEIEAEIARLTQGTSQ